MAKHPQDVEELVLRALKLDAGERLAFLKETCGEVRDRRRRVEALLWARVHPGVFESTEVRSLIYL